MSNYGFVYVFGNRAMPGIYKIGMTMQAPSRRAEELSSTTAAPMAFEVLAYGEIDNPAAFEHEMHSRFNSSRVSAGREFFRAPLELIIAALIENCGSVAVAYDDTDEFWRGK